MMVPGHTMLGAIPLHPKVKVQVYSLISIRMHVQPTPFLPWHGAATRAQPAHVDPTLDSCTRYPLLLGGQRQCGFKACPRLLQMTGDAGIEPR